MPTWLSWPRFHAPLYNFSPLEGAVMHRWTRWQHQMYFLATLLIMVIEIRFNFQTCVQCAEKAVSTIIFNIQWHFKQIWRLWHTEYQRVTSKGSRTMGSEWPDKHDKAGFGSVARGEGIFFAWSSFLAQQCGLWGGLSNGTVLPMHFIEEEGQHKKLHTAGSGQGGHVTTQLPPKKLVLTVPSYKE